MAFEVLRDAGAPLHAAEITRRAMARGFAPEGRTPAATMAAVLYVDINAKGKRSVFMRAGPQTFGLNHVAAEPKPSDALNELRYELSPGLSSKQKGDIAEARIAELVTLYGREALTCYKPVSDDEGIDLIVKVKNGSSRTVHLQVKSRLGATAPQLFTATTRPPATEGNRIAFVFCFSETDRGDLWPYIWFIPAAQFIARAHRLARGDLSFVASMSAQPRINRARPNAYSEFLIDKRGLSNKILDLLAARSV